MRIAVEIPPGIVSNDTTFADAASWADGNNVRFWQGKPQTIGGWSNFNVTLTGVCRNIHAWLNPVSNALTVAFGTHSKLQVYFNGTLSDITPAGLSVGVVNDSGQASGWGSGAWNEGTWSSSALTWYARTWSFANYGTNLMANPRGGTIYQWTGNPATPAAAVTNAPAAVTFMMVNSQRQLLAFGCNEEVSGTFNPMCIRGSDIEDPTVWTTTSANNAFEHILESGGKIVAARQIGAYIAVWTDTTLYLGDFIGAPDQTYRFDEIGKGHGLIGPNAVQVIDQTAIWLAPDYQFRMWTLGDKPRTLPCPISEDFTDNVVRSQPNKICTSTLGQFSEVWFHYPDARDGIENSRYIALGLSEGSGWFRGVMERTATIDSGVLAYPVKATAAGAVYYHENGNTADGAALEWSLQSADQYAEEGGRFTLIRHVQPDFEQQVGDVSLEVETRLYPNAAATSHGPFTLSPSTLKKDFRAGGRLISLIFSGGAVSGSYMRMGRPVFDAVTMGER